MPPTTTTSSALLSLETPSTSTSAQPATDADVRDWAATLAGPPAGVVGSPAWAAQHAALVRLTLTAHADALSGEENKEENAPPPPPSSIPDLKARRPNTLAPPGPDRVPSVLASTPGAMPALVRAVTYAAAWRARAWPAVAAALNDEGSGAATAAAVGAEAALFQEPAAASLLSLVLLSDVPSALLFGGEDGGDASLDAAAWASAAVGWLDGAEARGCGGKTGTTTTPAALSSPAAAATEAAFSASLAALGALRGLAQRASDLGPGVADRLAHGGSLAALAALLSSPPWDRPGACSAATKTSPPILLRRGGTGWVEVALEEAAATLPPHAGHAWLGALWLVAGPAFSSSARSAWGCGGGAAAAAALASRLATALRAPGPHHDALPPLAGLLLPALEGVIAAGSNNNSAPLAAVAAVAAATGGRGAAPPSSTAPILIQELPTPLTVALASTDWAGVAADSAAALAEEGGAPTANAGAGLLAVADALAAEPRLAGGEPTMPVVPSKKDGAFLVRVWARAGSAEAALTVRLSKKEGEEDGGEVVEAGEGRAAVRGRRARLRVVGEEADKALLFPPAGRLVASVAGRALEATFQLPSGEDGGGGGGFSALPPSCWLTAGLLASDGAALQLRLKRMASAADAVRVGGGWAAYACVGGALTVRE